MKIYISTKILTAYLTNSVTILMLLLRCIITLLVVCHHGKRNIIKIILDMPTFPSLLLIDFYSKFEGGADVPCDYLV